MARTTPGPGVAHELRRPVLTWIMVDKDIASKSTKWMKGQDKIHCIYLQFGQCIDCKRVTEL